MSRIKESTPQEINGGTLKSPHASRCWVEHKKAPSLVSFFLSFTLSFTIGSCQWYFRIFSIKSCVRVTFSSCPRLWGTGRDSGDRRSFMSPRILPILLCSATSPFWRSPFWRDFGDFRGKMQYLRRDKKDEEDGKWSLCVFIHFLRTFCKKFYHDPTLLLVLGAQSNPFQNLDKSAVLQEVSLELFVFCLSKFFFLSLLKAITRFKFFLLS